MVLCTCSQPHGARKPSFSRLIERRGGEEGEEEIAHKKMGFYSLCLQACGEEREIANDADLPG